MVKEENLRIRQENEFMSNQWDKASPAEKPSGIAV